MEPPANPGRFRVNSKELLESEWGLDLTRWQLTHPLGISDDGRTIVGYGTNPAGQTMLLPEHVP